MDSLFLTWRWPSDASSERISGVAWLAAAHRVVVDDATDGVEAAHVQAGVAALLADAGVQAGAVGADDALGSAVGRRADVRRPAGADGTTAGVTALGVRSARRRAARVLGRGRGDGHRAAARPGVAAEAGRAVADRVVVDDSALGVLVADARARVDALVASAGLVLRALGVAGALGLALDVWVSDVRLQTGAHCHCAALRALGVDAARGRRARLDDHRPSRLCGWRRSRCDVISQILTLLR